MTRRRLAFAVAAGLSLLPAGSGADTPAEPAAGRSRAEQRLALAPLGNLVEQWITGPGNLFLRRPRPDFAQYRALRIEPPNLYYKEHSAIPISQDQATLTRAFHQALTREVTNAVGLPATDKRGAGVLRVRGEASEIELARVGSGAGNSRVTSIVQPSGSVYFVLELADDATGDPLVRISVRRPMPGGIYTGPWSPDLDRARLLFRTFATDARQSLGNVFPRGDSSS